MNSIKTAIIIDSGCDVSEELINQYDIKVLRLKIIYGMDVFSDGKDIEASTVYDRFPKEIPGTSTPNSAEVMDMVDAIREEGYERIIAICISSGLSGTYNTVKSTLDEVEDMETFAFDTKNISIGSGFFAIWAAKQIEQGASYQSIVEGLTSKIKDSKVFYYMDTLDYLKAGGRIGNVTGFIGKAFDLKPIISCNDKGVYYTVSMMRGRKNGIKKLMNVVFDEDDGSKVWISVLHGGAADKTEEAKEQLKGHFENGEIIVEKQIIASLAVHTGPGLLGIGIFKL